MNYSKKVVVKHFTLSYGTLISRRAMGHKPHHLLTFEGLYHNALMYNYELPLICVKLMLSTLSPFAARFESSHWTILVMSTCSGIRAPLLSWHSKNCTITHKEMHQ